MKHEVQPLTPGDKMPNFGLPDAGGQVGILYNEVKGGPVLLIVAASPATPKSAALLAAVEAAQARLAACNAQVFGLFGGPPQALVAAAGPRSFTLFADPQGAVVPALLAQAGLGGRPDGLCLLGLDANQRLIAAQAGGTPEAMLEALLTSLEAWSARETAVTVEHLERAAPVLILPDLLEPAFCQELMDRWETKGHREGGMSTGEGNVYAPDSKKNREHLVTDVELNKRISFTLARRTGPELSKIFNYNQPFRFEAHMIMCYTAERQDFFALHRDNLRQTDQRRFALSLNLNDGYEGGELSFPEYGPHRYRPPAGGGLLFSGNLLHEAHPVIKGTRFVLVTFYCDVDQPDSRIPADKRRQMAV